MSEGKLNESVLEHYPDGRRESLISILQAAQDELGYISRDAVEKIGRRLNLPVTNVYGIATFYDQFRFRPAGKLHCQVCRGTACHVSGSAAVLESLKQVLKVEPGQTTRDGRYSLEVVNCIGACGLAPVVTTNGEFHASVTPDGVRNVVQQHENREKSEAHGQHGPQH